jgi:hypothetical protein
MDGEKRSIEKEPKWVGKTETWSTEHLAFDGRRAFQVYYDHQHPGTMTKLIVMPRPAPYFHDYHPDTWLGLHLHRTDETLLSLLSRSGARVSGWEAIDDSECVRVDLGSCPTRNGDEISWKVWLDPENDWLPRQLVAVETRQESSGPRVIQYRQTVTKFSRVADPLLGRERSFPVEFFGAFAGTYGYEVLSVAVNNTIASDNFTIEPAPGAQVMEHPSPNSSSPGRQYIAGGEKAAAGVREEIIRQARNLDTTIDGVTAAPDAGINLNLISWILGIVFLSAAFIVRWKRS